MEILKRKLTIAQLALKSEKEKRRNQARDATAKIKSLIAEKRELKKNLLAADKLLVAAETEKRSAEKEQIHREKMEAARNSAVSKFVVKWEKSYLASEAKSKRTTKGKRGRPRTS